MNQTVTKLLAMCVTFTTVGRASEIDRFLEDSTCAVARISLSQINLPESIRLANELFPGLISPQVQTSTQLIGGGLIGALRQSGVENIYVSLSTLEATTGRAALIVPCPNNQLVVEQFKVIRSMIPPTFGYNVYSIDGAVLFATDAAAKRLLQSPSANRADLRRILDSQSAANIQLALSFGESVQQSMASLWPDRVPDYFPVKLSPKQMVKDVQGVAIQIDSAPNFRVYLGVNTQNEAATKRVSDVLNDCSKLYLGGVAVRSALQSASIEIKGESANSIVGKLKSDLFRRRFHMQQSNNLKQIILAFLNFEDKYRGFPPRMTVTEEGKSLLSWRVYILPFIGQQSLYEQFRLHEPWDSNHNRPLIAKMPSVFQSLDFPDLESGMTCVQMPVMEGSMWSGSERTLLTIGDVTDGLSNTLALVIAPKEQAVVWTKPDELELRPNQLIEDFFGDRIEVQLAIMDGSVQTLARKTVTPKILKAMLTHQGGESFEFPR